MFPISRILLPVDFSERCLGATRYAEALASHFNAEIALLHVVEPVRYEVSAMDFGGVALSELAAGRAALARKQLEAFEVEQLPGVRVRRVLVEGDPAHMIVDHAHAEQVDLITLPTHGYGPFRRFILGSVTAKVLHDADCPVWTGVHLEDAPPVQQIAFRSVLCAVDLGPQSRKALCWASHMASAFQAKLTVMHAAPAIERPGENFNPNLVAEITASARAELEKLSGAADGEVLVEAGDPPKVVCRAAKRLKSDLLVIGRGSAAGLFGRLRTNAYAIIRESPCPVVSV